MSRQVQIRRGTTAQHAAFTGAQGELSYNTTTKRLHAHDGSTVGGAVHALLSEMQTADAAVQAAAEATAAAALAARIAVYAGTGSGQGLSQLGAQDAGGYFTGTDGEAITQEIGAKQSLQLPSIMSSIPTALHAAIYAKTSTADVSSYFQSLIDTGTPFTVPSGAKFRLNSALTWKSGAKMLSYGDDYLLGSAHDWCTVLEFDSSLCTSGILFDATQKIQDFSFDGIVFDTTGTGAAYTSFKMWNITNRSGNGAFHFKLGTNSIQHCYQAIYADNAFFSGDFGNLSITLCHYGFIKTSTSFITSLTGNLKFFQVFSPMDWTNATYCNLNVFTDTCGITAVASLAVAPSATEMPILFKGNACVNVKFGYFGMENSNAIRFRLENYSSVEANLFEFVVVAQLFQSSATRVSNIVQAQQAMFSLVSSWLKISNYRALYSTGNGYPTVGAWGAGTNYFLYASGDASTRLTFTNSIADMTPYQVCTSGMEQYLTANRTDNGAFTFGGAGTWRQDFNYANGFLTVGSTTYSNSYHNIVRNVTYAAGDDILRLANSGGSFSLRVCVTNAGSPNAANTGLRVSADGVTSRSINAVGTINASGADYAEYERNNGLTIAKGQIAGFKSDGTLTLTYSEAVRFGVKSTNPSYVGGDGWCTAVEPDDGATPEAREAFKAQIEVDRAKVDRIAYSGKVPCNVGGSTPGQYIIAAPGPDDSIIGLPVTSPSFEQYRSAVGRVNRVLNDGRAEIAVIVH